LKKSKKPTEYIIIKASTRSKSDSVEFVIVHVSQEWVELTTKRLAAISEFKENKGLNHHCYWVEPVGYYNSPTSQDLLKKLLSKHEDWAFIELEPNEINSLPIPESKLNAHQFMITKDGIGQYKAYGKGTSEEFYIEQFNLYKVIIKLLNNMNKSKLTFLMATICLNFSYAQLKEKLAEQSQLQLYRYGFTGFKSSHKPGFKIKKDVANGGKTIIVRNYTVEQLFAIAYGTGTPLTQEQTIININEPKKLQEIRCYKLFVPQDQIANFYTIMQQNLKMEFPGYKVTLEHADHEKFMIITDGV